VLEALQEPPEDHEEADLRLYPEYAKLWELFAAYGPAWRFHLQGGIAGIGRAQLLATMKAFRTRPKRYGRLLKDLTLIGQRMREAMAKRRAR